MANFWAKFYEPLPSAPLKPNNASAIFGGQSPYGLRAAEPSIFRPKDPTPNKQTKPRKKVTRSHSDVGLSKYTEKRKSREPPVIKRRPSPRNSQNCAVENDTAATPHNETEEKTSGEDSPDGKSNGDRFPLFIPVHKPSENKSRKTSNSQNHKNGTKSAVTGKSKTDSQKSNKTSESPFDSLRREKTDFIVRPRRSPSDAPTPNTVLKREKSDITLKRSQSPSGVPKPRALASPASLRREKSEIILKRSNPPGNLTREKSDLVRPRVSTSPGQLRREKSDITATKRSQPSAKVVKPVGSASPGSLRREKSDITATKRSQPSAKVVKPVGSASPGSLRREKSDITAVNRSQSPATAAKPVGSASPGSLRREKSDITATKRSQSPAGAASTVKPRCTASPGPLRREKSDITATRRSQSPSAATTPVKPRSSASPGSLRRENSEITARPSRSPSSTTNDKSDLVKPGDSTSPSSPKREKSDVTKKPPHSPSKSGLPQPRVCASVKPASKSSEVVLSSDQKAQLNSVYDVKSQSCSSSSSSAVEPNKESTWTKSESNSEVGKDKNEPTKDSISSVSEESPKQNVYHSGTSTHQRTNVKQEQQTHSSTSVNGSSPQHAAEAPSVKSQISKIPEPSKLEGVQRVSSPDQKQDSVSERNSTSSAVSDSQTDISNCSSVDDLAEMSKIPTPTSTQVSRIPSLTKASAPASRIPPKSKIPSFSNTKSDEETKKTGIASINDKPTSKLPAPQRADPAKENKDPALHDVEEVNKQNSKISRIPSTTKSGIPTTSRIPSLSDKATDEENGIEDATKISKIPSPTKATTPTASRIPSLSRQESQGDRNSSEGETETPKSRIPSISDTQPSSAATPFSKIPSFSKKHSLTKTPSKEEPESKIPHLSGATTPKTSGIPKPEVTTTGIPRPAEVKPVVTESRIPSLHGTTPKESGIPKPEVSLSGIPKPEVTASGIPKPGTPTTPTDSKIPQFSTPPRSKIPGPHGSLTRKDSDERIKKQKLEEAVKVNETLPVEQSTKVDGEAAKVVEPNEATPSPAKVAPPPPPRQDVSQDLDKSFDMTDSMSEAIFSEAKRMEELLRNESIVVEVPSDEKEKSQDVTAKAEISKQVFQSAPAAVEMADQTVSIAESSNNNVKETVDKKEQFSFQTFGKREDTATTKPAAETSLSLGLKKEEEEEAEEANVSDAASPMEHAPAIDTLGQYEQQSRRSRSRQRKIISPDADDANKTFEEIPANEEPESKTPEPAVKTDDTEAKAKTGKSKSKHDKPKFVIESSLGADFYQSKSSHSKDSIAEEAKPKEVVVIQNKAFDDTKGIPKTDIKKGENTAQATNKNSAAFEDVELSSNRASKAEMKAWSMEELDEKTVKCSCGRGGKCTIM